MSALSALGGMWLDYCEVKNIYYVLQKYDGTLHWSFVPGSKSHVSFRRETEATSGHVYCRLLKPRAVIQAGLPLLFPAGRITLFHVYSLLLDSSDICSRFL